MNYLFDVVHRFNEFKCITRLIARCHQFPVKMTKFYRKCYAKCFFSRTSRLGIFLPVPCFPSKLMAKNRGQYERSNLGITHLSVSQREKNTPKKTSLPSYRTAIEFGRNELSNVQDIYSQIKWQNTWNLWMIVVYFY